MQCKISIQEETGIKIIIQFLYIGDCMLLSVWSNDIIWLKVKVKVLHINDTDIFFSNGLGETKYLHQGHHISVLCSLLNAYSKCVK